MKQNYCGGCGFELNSVLGHQNFCPGCGQDFGRRQSPSAWRPVQSGGGQWRRYATMESSVPLALPSGGDGGSMTAYRRSPARNPEFGADVVVVLGQAGLIGLAGAIFSFPLPWMVDGLPWWTFGPVGAWAFAGAIWGLIKSNRSHMWNVETITQESEAIQGAGPAVAAPSGKVAIEISQVDGDGRFVRGLNLELPGGVSQADFVEFAKGVTGRGGSLAVGSWTGRGKLFSKSVYNALLDELMEAGIVEWIDENNHSVGRQFAAGGQEALKGLM